MKQAISPEKVTFIENFLKAQAIISDSHVQSIVLYGSQVETENINYQSDIDLFIIDNRLRNYKIGQLYHNIHFDINSYSLNSLPDIVTEAKLKNNTYYESIIKRNYVLKDSNDTFKHFSEYIKSIPPITNQKSLNASQVSKLYELYNNFIFSSPNHSNNFMNDYWYYNLLEYIRIIYYQLNSCSYINPFKVYETYKDKRVVDNYCLQMPPQLFINLFNEALKTKNFSNRIITIKKFLELLKIDKNQFLNLQEQIPRTDLFLQKNQIMLNILGIKNNFCRVEKMLLNNHPFKEYAYHIFLFRLYNLYSKIYDNDINSLIIEAVKEKNNFKRISLLKNIYSILCEEYNFDYNNYKLLFH